MGGKANQTEKIPCKLGNFVKVGHPVLVQPTMPCFAQSLYTLTARPMSADVHEGSWVHTRTHSQAPLLCVQICLVLKAKEKLNWRLGYFLCSTAGNQGIGVRTSRICPFSSSCLISSTVGGSLLKNHLIGQYLFGGVGEVPMGTKGGKMGNRNQSFYSDSCFGHKFLLCLQLLWYQRVWVGLLGMEDMSDDMAGGGRRKWENLQIGNASSLHCAPTHAPAQLFLKKRLATFIEHMVYGRHCAKSFTNVNSFSLSQSTLQGGCYCTHHSHLTEIQNS